MAFLTLAVSLWLGLSFGLGFDFFLAARSQLEFGITTSGIFLFAKSGVFFFFYFFFMTGYMTGYMTG